MKQWIRCILLLVVFCILAPYALGEEWDFPDALEIIEEEAFKRKGRFLPFTALWHRLFETISVTDHTLPCFVLTVVDTVSGVAI